MAAPDIEVKEVEAPAVDPVEGAIAALRETFPDLTDDPRPNYSGLMVPADQLLAVAGELKNNLGFEYDYSLLNVHNKGNLKSHLASIVLNYAWAKKTKSDK